MTLEVRSESPCLMECDMICTSAWLAVGEHHQSASHCSVPVGHLCHLFLTQNNLSHGHCYSPWSRTNETSHIAKQQTSEILQELTHCCDADLQCCCRYIVSTGKQIMTFQKITVTPSSWLGKDEGTVFSSNKKNYSLNDRASHARRLETSCLGVLNLQSHSTVLSVDCEKCLSLHDTHSVMQSLHNMRKNSAYRDGHACHRVPV